MLVDIPYRDALKIGGHETLIFIHLNLAVPRLVPA